MAEWLICTWNDEATGQGRDVEDRGLEEAQEYAWGYFEPFELVAGWRREVAEPHGRPRVGIVDYPPLGPPRRSAMSS